MKTPLHGDNRGLTLVELLVGVLILSIIIVPLLHTFVTGAGTERKSRIYGNATVAAQNLLEQVQAREIDDILRNSALLDGAQFYNYAKESYVPAGLTAAAPEADIKTTYYLGLPGYTYDGSAFDALVTLDFDPESRPNDHPVSIGNAIDAYMDMSDADDKALDTFRMECGGLVADPQLLLKRDLTRKMSVTIVGAAQPGVYTVTAQFDYSATVSYTVNDSEGNPIARTYAFSTSERAVSSVTPPSVEAGQPLFSVFLFYDGLYRANGLPERISIDSPIDANVFVVNVNPEPDAAAYPETQIWYRYQQFKREGAARVPVNHLVWTNLPGEKVEYRAFISALERVTLDVSPYLVERERLDRRFSVNVRLYAPGSGFTGTPLLSIDSSKLNY